MSIWHLVPALGEGELLQPLVDPVGDLEEESSPRLGVGPAIQVDREV